MKSVTVMLKSGVRVDLNAKDWTVSSNYISLMDDAGKHVATFPSDAIFGLWVSGSLGKVQATLQNS
jgi:hypothetical protein